MPRGMCTTGLWASPWAGLQTVRSRTTTSRPDPQASHLQIVSRPRRSSPLRPSIAPNANAPVKRQCEADATVHHQTRSCASVLTPGPPIVQLDVSLDRCGSVARPGDHQHLPYGADNSCCGAKVMRPTTPVSSLSATCSSRWKHTIATQLCKTDWGRIRAPHRTVKSLL